MSSESSETKSGTDYVLLDYSNVIPTYETATNELLVIVATAFIFMMQLGFALLENGSVRTKNSKNILIKNMFDACASSIAFWLIGFGLAFGHEDKGNGIIGTNGNYFASYDFSKIENNAYLLWIF